MLRYVLLAVILWVSWKGQLNAQVYPTDGCYIRYQYDGAGNRTQRDWHCVGEAQGGTNRSNDGTAESAAGALATVHLNVAPNPTSDHLRVSLTEEMGTGTLLIHDSKGREVLRSQMNGSNLELDVNSLQPGPYFISYQHAGERIVTGFGVQR